MMNADGSPFDYIRRFAPFPRLHRPPGPLGEKKEKKKFQGGRVSGPRPPARASERRLGGGKQKKAVANKQSRESTDLYRHRWKGGQGHVSKPKGEGILDGRLKADVTILCGGNRGESSELMRRLKVIKAALAIERREGGHGEESRDVTLAGGGGRKSECTA